VATSVLAIIPARAGSERIPNKNMHPLLGVPLIQYSIDTLLSSQIVSTILVSSDSEEVEKLCKNYEKVKFLKRNAKLASPHSSTLDVVKDILSISEFRNFDLTMVTQTTSPNRTLEDIEKSLSLLMADANANSVVSVSELRHQYRPEKLGQLIDGQMRSIANLDYIFEPSFYPQKSLFYRNGAVYVGRTSAILTQNCLLPQPVLGYVMKREHSIDIDYPEDFAVAEYFIQNHNDF